MSGLAGYDMWKLASPYEDEIEPSAEHYAQARAELAADAENEEADEDDIHARACELMQADIDQSVRDAAEAEAESRLDDREDGGRW